MVVIDPQHQGSSGRDAAVATGSSGTVLGASEEIQVFIKGVAGGTKSYRLRSCEPVNSVKLKIQDKEGLPVEYQRLLFAGKQLRDEYSLSDYNVQSGCCLCVVLSLVGGMRSAGRATVSAAAPEWRKKGVAAVVEKIRYTKDALLTAWHMGLAWATPEEVFGLFNVISHGRTPVNPLPAVPGTLRSHDPRALEAEWSLPRIAEAPGVEAAFATVFTPRPTLRPSTAAGSPEDIAKQAFGALNKLSADNFDRILIKFMDSGFGSSVDLFMGTVERIVSKAQDESVFCGMYVRFVKCVHDRIAFKDEALGAEFRRLLLQKCEEDFSAASASAVGVTGLLDDDENRREQAKSKHSGHLLVIAELYRYDLIDHKVMRRCITELLDSPDDAKLVGAAVLLTSIGKKLERDCSDHNKKSKFLCFFKSVVCIAKEGKHSIRVQSFFRKLFDSRDQGWPEYTKPEDMVPLMPASAHAHAPTAPQAPCALSLPIAVPVVTVVAVGKVCKSELAPQKAVAEKSETGESSWRSVASKPVPAAKVPKDKQVACREGRCGKLLSRYTVAEQEVILRKAYAPPVRCTNCREKKKAERR